MIISKIKIKNLRVLKNLDIKPTPSINIIFGKNGAGKTSILESIYILARNRSFRQTHQKNLISNNEQQLSINASIRYLNGSTQHIELKKSSTKTEFSINNKKQYKLTTLAKSLPIGIVTPNIHKIIEEGPKYRRRLLDWGVFHVEHSYASLVQKYNKLLLQRNSAIRKNISNIHIWDKQLIRYAELITIKRLDYLKGLISSFNNYSGEFFFKNNINFSYRKGWDENYSLEENFKRKVSKDIKNGFTSIGPHRANLIITFNDHLVANYLSRGQQKLLGILLIIAQLDQIKSSIHDPPILLLDDIVSELDEDNRIQFSSVLTKIHFQTFMTINNLRNFKNSFHDYEMFHVEQGKIR